VSVTLRCRIVVDGLSCVELGVCLSCVLGVVAQPLRRAETLAIFLVLVWPLCGSGGEGGSRVPLALAGRYR
jgi:hypothetical protein